MTKRQKNEQMMGGSVSQTFEQYNAEWSSSPVFVEGVTTHTDNMNTVNSLEQQQRESMEMKGLVRDKNLLRLLMADSLGRIINGVKGYAMAAGNNQLFTSVDYSPSAIRRMSDVGFISCSTSIWTIATANAVNILPYGITQAEIDDLEGDNTAFNAIYKKPKTFRGQLKTYTHNLELAIKAMVKHLRENMDYQVRSMFPNTEFMSVYFNNRKVYHMNEAMTSIQGTVTDAGTGKRLRNVIVELVDYPAPGEMQIRSTNANGHYSFKKIDMTNATLRFRAGHYTTTEMEIPVNKGGENVCDMQLMAEPVNTPAMV